MKKPRLATIGWVVCIAVVVLGVRVWIAVVSPHAGGRLLAHERDLVTMERRDEVRLDGPRRRD